MAFKKTVNWKEEVIGYCTCLVKFPTTIEKECTEISCPANQFRLFLIQKEPPGKKDFMEALLRIGCFNRKQLIGVMCDLFKMRPNAGARQIVLAITRLKKRGKKVTHDDLDHYVIQ